MRVLACLSVVGFRIFALNLISFLEFVIFNDREFWRLESTFMRDWKVYDDCSTDNHNTNRKPEAFTKARKMCFLVDRDFPKVHTFIRKMLDSEKIDEKEFVIRRQTNGFYKEQDIERYTRIKRDEPVRS